jgi:hypothetical protein
MTALLAAVALVGCPASTVHYNATPVGAPWVATRAVTGHLFAYGGRTLMDAGVNAADGLVLYTHGRTPDGATKILWVVRRRFGPTLRLKGTRMDGPGSFTQRLAHGGGHFPSIVDVPAAGCWKLALQTGKVRATFVLTALDAPAAPSCEATPVFPRGVPHPTLGSVGAWMPATPRSSGIVAVAFVSTVPGADRAVIYAGGRAPEGWNTKFLWWSPKPSGPLKLVGRRMDGVGRFEQIAYGAWSDSPPVTGTIFPSIVEIPSAGCWAVTGGIGARAGLVVFEAVPPG